MPQPTRVLATAGLLGVALWFGAPPLGGQMIDRTQAPNSVNDGIAKSLTDEIGAGRGDWNTPASSSFLIHRDPYRAVRRGRELFQRKFTRVQLQGPAFQDGIGDIDTTLAIGAGLSDSCGGCHGRPRGSGGTGGDVVTRPDSRDAPHLFGLGLREMLADEITQRLRQIRDEAIQAAHQSGHPVIRALVAKGIGFGTVTASPNGAVDTSDVRGVDPDLRVRPFFAQGGTISIREFVVGALHAELGLDAADPDLARAAAGQRVTTPGGMVLDGTLDRTEGPPVANPGFDPNGNVSGSEVPTAIVDYLEFYLLNYFKPGTSQQSPATALGLRTFKQIGCNSCHVADLTVDHDRRVADVETAFDARHGIFNRLFATATPLVTVVPDGSGYPPGQAPRGGPFLVRNIFTDFKRHDIGPSFYERNWDGTFQREFLTRALWGVGNRASYGHDGRSISLTEVILRHGGEAQDSRDAFAALADPLRRNIIDFLESLVLFPPDDTASNLDPGDPSNPLFPQAGHGSIRLTALFNDPSDKE